MKSIKPGRGPSAMSAVGSLLAAAFGIFWTAMAPSFMKLFGIVFIGVAVAQFFYNYHNATSRNRLSLMDITDHEEEPDPLNERFGNHPAQTRKAAPGRYCPYCGDKVGEDFEYCDSCGRKLPPNE